jgi:uncharacterized protein YjbI with pentapeptide repeats
LPPAATQLEDDGISVTHSKVALSDADLSYIDLRMEYLLAANFFGATMCNADLTKSELASACLRGANLTGANLKEANLAGADLTETNLSGTDLRGAKNLAQQQLDKACGTNVKLDPPLKLHKPCLPPSRPYVL